MRRVIAVISILALAVAVLSAVGPVQVVAQDGVPDTVTVDERTEDFTPKGYGWREDDFGHAGHHYWVPARSKQSRVGIWRASLEPVRYKVLAKIPARHASTRKAVYKLKTVDGWVKRVRSQYANRGGWTSLGTHLFGTTAEVRLGDMTLDTKRTKRKVAFDALRFIPVDRPTPPTVASLESEP